MTFEEFQKKLPPGIIGAIMHRADGLWSIKIWLEENNPSKQAQASGFHIFLRGKESETTEELLARALPTAEAFVKAAGITKGLKL